MTHDALDSHSKNSHSKNSHSKNGNTGRSKNFSLTRMIFGLALIVAGTLFFLEEMRIVDNAWALVRYWPVVLIAAGIGKALFPGRSSGRFGGIVLAVIGAWILAYDLEYIDVEFWDLWPLFLILIGVRLLTRGARRQLPEDSSTINAVAVLGGTQRNNTSQNFRGGDLMAIMGGCEIDLRNAKISESPAEIDVLTLFGGTEIRVPADWTISLKGLPILGALEDETHNSPDPDMPMQELVITGLVAFGGLSIKN